MIDWKLFASTYAMIFVAEIPDKTALASFVLATRNRAQAVFVGAAGAFLIQSMVAVAFGSLLSLAPHRWVSAASGVAFLIFAILAYREDEEEVDVDAAPVRGYWQTAGKAFMAVFLAEWGDLTQLATAAVAAHTHRPGTIFLSSVAALWSVCALGVFAAHHLKRRIPTRALARLSAVIFAVVGVAILASAISG